jgi:hypothetical protein
MTFHFVALRRVLVLGAGIATAFIAGAAMAANGAQTLAEVTLCNPGSDVAQLYSDDGLRGIDTKLANGSAVCAQQSMRMLGVAEDRTYIYWTAMFAEKSADGTGAGATHVIGQIGEMGADGSLRMVYRFGNEGAEEFDPRLIERNGDVFIALASPYQIVLMRGESGFSEIGTNFYYLDAAKVKADLPEGYVAQPLEDADTYRSAFSADDLSVSVRVGLADEVFPRTFTKVDYDRNTVLRFPLERRGEDLVPGKGVIVEDPEDYLGGIGETPLIVSVPKETRACDLQAYLEDAAADGVSVHAAPNATSAVVANLPAMTNAGQDNAAFGAQVDIVGVQDGWFLIENASHPYEMFEPEPGTALASGIGSNSVRAAYRGRGWIEGSRLSVDIQAGDALRKTADEASPQAFSLMPDEDDNLNDVTDFLDCDGRVAKLAVTRSDGQKGEGWIDRSGDEGILLCANQGTTCN